MDRIIFSLVNCHQIKKEHFESKNGGVYLNKEGKKIFVTAFEDKLQQKFVQKGNKSFTYKQLLEKEVRDYQQYILEEKKYKPYKYY